MEQRVDIAGIARDLVDELREREPVRKVIFAETGGPALHLGDESERREAGGGWRAINL